MIFNIMCYRRSICSEKGASGILPLMFSTMGGMVFLLSFYNLTQFTAARSAADQAARRAARCLSTTDPDSACRVINNTSERDTPATWFGYPSIDGPGLTQVELFQYSGDITADVYGANYSSYEILTGRPVVNWEEKKVKPLRLFGLLNSYAHLKGDAVFDVVNGSGQRQSCRINNIVEVPLGVDFDEPGIYTNARWCSDVRDFDYRSDSSCSSLGNDWRIDRNTCTLTIPTPRSSSDPAWLLLGGESACEGEGFVPLPDEMDLDPGILEAHFNQKYGSIARPGDKGRPYPITFDRQYVVINVYTCNPSEFFNRVNSGIMTNEQIKQYFVHQDSITEGRFLDLPFEDFKKNTDSDPQNAFLFSGNPNSNYIAKEDWTYIDWHRKDEDKIIRSISRKVCKWYTHDEAVRLLPEFASSGPGINPLEGQGYHSGVRYGALEEISFVDAPSCLQPEIVPQDETSYDCQNRTVSGQPGSFDACQGWAGVKRGREANFRLNVQSVIRENSNPAWENLLPRNQFPISGFKTEIGEYWAGDIREALWDFSWAPDRYMGLPVSNPGAVRDRSGTNPKSLPPELAVRRYRQTNNNDENQREIRENLLQNIIQYEGAGTANLYDLGDPLSIVQVLELEPEVLEIENTWPFLPTPQPRPYISGEMSRGVFDYGLNCNPKEQCMGSPRFTDLEEALRTFANPVTPVDLTNRLYEFNFTESPAGLLSMSIDEAQGFPACTQFRTQCGEPQRGSLTLIGSSIGVPFQCTNGQFLDCYPRYDDGAPIETIEHEVDIDAAKLVALGEIRRLIPGSGLCSDSLTSNCVHVDVRQIAKEVEVNVSFIAPLTTPFTEFFSANSITISTSKREVVETERLGRRDSRLIVD